MGPRVKALAVDLGGSHAACAVVADREVVAVETRVARGRPRPRGALPAIAGALQARGGLGGRSRRRPAPGSPSASAAWWTPSAGRVLSTNAKYDDAPGLDLPEWCRRSFGLPFRIENDARLALLGERYAGAAQGTDDAVMMTLGPASAGWP